jgi:hypothetical protein
MSPFPFCCCPRKIWINIRYDLNGKGMNAGGSGRKGQNGGLQGPLCHWLMAAETSTGWQVGVPAT